MCLCVCFSHPRDQILQRTFPTGNAGRGCLEVAVLALDKQTFEKQELLPGSRGMGNALLLSLFVKVCP